jgi:tetratricopeptide (TPR) repeat protein
MFVLKPWHRAIWIAAFAGIAMSLLAWFAWRDPAMNFLTRDGRAEWIVFPTAVDAHGHWFTGLDATFRREFTLTEQPSTAHLSVRVMRRGEVRINGASVRFRPNDSWKEIASVEVPELLRAGTNAIEVRVFNDNGPPALWLQLTTNQEALRSDTSWKVSLAGSSWHHATPATAVKTPRSGNSIASSESTFAAARKIWVLCIVLFAIASVTGAFIWNLSYRYFTARRLERTMLIVIAGLWLLLFWNNTQRLPFHEGFDSAEHLKYIAYIQEHRALPLPNEGLEMYQPPLYYLIGATVLSACNLSINDAASVAVLRFLGGFLGVAQFVLVFLSVRLLLPVRAAFIGLLLAAFLPMHLYLAQYVTNEMLAATLATAALYLCLRLLKSETPRASQFLLLGFTLGAAMLAKATSVLLLPVVIAAIAGRLIYARASIAVSSRNLGLLLAICLAVCGWHYSRIWLKFGTPLLGNWDAASGFTWWQDPGYHTVTDYLRFGRSLLYPLFSGFAGFADGIYSTLWGDGLCAGAASLTLIWNEQPMLAGYLWSVIPTVLVLTGAVAAIVWFLRKPSSELFLLLGFLGVLALAMIFMTLKIPSYAQAKAFYALSALTPFCFFGALGWETLTQRRTTPQIILGMFVLVWALNSFATYWTIPSATQHLYAAKALGTEGKMDLAAAEAQRAIEADPSNATARGFRALSLLETGQEQESIGEAEHAVELNPSGSGPHLDLAICVNRSDRNRAIVEARRAIELGPENSSAYQFLMSCLLESQNYNEAAELGRDWLAVSSYDVASHSALGSALAAKGDLVPAVQQLGYIMMLRPDLEQAHAQLRQILLSLAKEADGLQRLHEIAANAPDSPRMLDELAWLFATYPDSKSRDGTEAVRLAEHASELTERKVPALLDTLAAAYAEAGDFSRAISVGEEALKKAGSAGDNDAVKLSENILESLRKNLPYRQEPK